MGKYSSDSDSDKRISRKHKRSSSRRSSSDSSDRHRRRRLKKSDRHSKSRRSHRSKDIRRERSRSSDRYRSRRSRSRSYIREYSSKSRRRVSSSSGSSRSDSSRSEKLKVRPAETIVIQDDDEVAPVDVKAVEEINEDGFEPKPFVPSSKKVPDNIVIDLRKQTIKVPAVERTEPDTIFHHNLFLNEEARMEKWVKELFSFRHKALLK